MNVPDFLEVPLSPGRGQMESGTAHGILAGVASGAFYSIQLREIL